MRPQYHLASSVLTASILYLVFKSWSMAFSCFLSGIFIDTDHIYDYLREFGLPFRVKDFIHSVYNGKFHRMTLFLHSWELLFLIGIIAWFTKWNPTITGVLIGFGHHLVLDTVHNSRTVRAYSFIWRWNRDFEFAQIFPTCVKKKY
jgi:hypothetical protein